MINENREKIFFDLISALKRERDFVICNKREIILEELLNKMENVDIYYIRSNKASNSVKFFEKNAIIIWDLNFWECFEKYLMQIEYCKQNNENITQGVITVISQFLSEKYRSIPQISSFLAQIPENFGFKLSSLNQNRDKVYEITQICKLFSFFHEIGHLEQYKKSSDKIRACQELVLDLFSALEESDFSTYDEWADLGWKSVCLIKENNGGKILEELTCDVFAVINMIDYYMDNKINESTFQLAYNSVVALENISTFQNMFNVVNYAWDSHYAEMKYELPVREKSVNSYINELTMSRNELCSLILVIVIYKMLKLDRCESKKLWECMDMSRVNNKDVISCLANDDFICQAIEDAFG